MGGVHLEIQQNEKGKKKVKQFTVKWNDNDEQKTHERSFDTAAETIWFTQCLNIYDSIEAISVTGLDHIQIRDGKFFWN